MPDDIAYAVGDEFVGDRNALLRVGDIIADRDSELLAEDAAVGVDALDSRFDTDAVLFSISGIRSRHRSGDAEHDIRPRGTDSRGSH